MVTVKKFLCFKLEKGGKFIGWLAKISSAFVIIVSIIVLIALPFLTCEPFEEKFNSCTAPKLGIATGFIIIILLMAIAFYIYHILIQAINQHNHKRVLPAVICEIVGLIICVFQTIYYRNNVEYTIANVICLIVGAYFVIVLYSIYAKFKHEKSNALKEDYRNP